MKSRSLAASLPEWPGVGKGSMAAIPISCRHQPVDDAFTQTGGEFRGETMAENLLGEPVADGNGARNGKMRNDIEAASACQAFRAVRIELRHGATRRVTSNNT